MAGPERRPALVRMRGGGPEFERAMRRVEALGGRVLHAYPPLALIAELPPGADPVLVEEPAVAAVDRDEVPTTRGEAAGPHAAVIAAWNDHLRARGAPERPTRGLAWDAPGLQPPDPPPAERERLRRRERRMREDPEADPEDDDRS